jgi:NAD(P)H-hydrate epimerase
MIPVTTAKEMRKLDAFTIQELGIPSLVLMENAGRGVVDEMTAMLGDMQGAAVVIVCGRGNNGGDGLVAARYLESAGAQVEVYLTSAEKEVSGDAKVQLGFAKKLGLDVKSLSEAASLARFRKSLPGADILVDAILGTGASGKLDDRLAKIVKVMNESDEVFRVAVDAPTGVEVDTGRLMGEAFRADLTVTFGLPKRGHFLLPGREHTGSLAVVDIGIPRKAVEEAGMGVVLAEEEDARSFLPRRPPDAHKGTCGTVLIVAASEGFTGAAALAGEAALISGAGLVHLAIPRSLNDILEMKVTEVITKPLPETDARTLSAAALPKILELAAGARCVAVGPGLSMHPETSSLVRELVARVGVPLVLDADGINALAGHTEILSRRKWPTVITPHPGELSRLTGESAAIINSARIERAARYAKEWNTVLLLKGAPTIVSHPDGFSSINATGNAGMASGGTGDVLTGMLGSLIAQGTGIFEAAVAAAYFHGMAADVAVEEIGEWGLCASDILDFLPQVMAHEQDDLHAHDPEE